MLASETFIAFICKCDADFHNGITSWSCL